MRCSRYVNMFGWNDRLKNEFGVRRGLKYTKPLR